jgi:nitrite reductase/ring-hydroxylating ferredoxin subunit
MLTKEENELLTQTGPGTPCGDFMRRYWHPVALAEELEEGGPPVAVRLLGEDLVLFRDGKGQIGLLSRWCSHRGTDLSYGAAEEQGIRCGYHGWLYDIAGRCLEQPLEPPDSTLHLEIQHRAYLCQETAGLIFAYLGPGDAPLLPSYEFLGVSNERRRSTKYFLECNYLQGSEGSLDPMQRWFFENVFGGEGSSPEPADDIKVQVRPQVTNFGVTVATRREDGPGPAEERRSFMLPSLCAIPAIGVNGYTVHWHVPIDDTHHWRYVTTFKRDGELSDEDAVRNGIEPAEGYRLTNLWDREAMQRSFVVFSTAMAVSQGPIFDRTQENLQESDGGIIAMRDIVHRGIQDVQEGADPPHVVRDSAMNDFKHIVVGAVVPDG